MRREEKEEGVEKSKHINDAGEKRHKEHKTQNGRGLNKE